MWKHLRGIILVTRFIQSTKNSRHTHPHSHVYRPFFRDYPGEPVPGCPSCCQTNSVKALKTKITHQQPQPFHGHCMDQPALAGTSSVSLEDIDGAKFYCPHALLTATSTSGLRRGCWSSPQQSYPNCLCTLKITHQSHLLLMLRPMWEGTSTLTLSKSE